jgi:membrane protease YdiL (CAAX protease family)
LETLVAPSGSSSSKSKALSAVVFGFIFAFLQKKRDVMSAMIAHGVVDWIRFCIFGLPF